MSVFLHGPYPFDVRAVTVSALSALTALPASPTPSEAQQPGLYLIFSAESAILGFWVVFGSSYLEDGPTGPPDHHPPYVSGLLQAATEAVWWRKLRVAPRAGGTWRPVVVLEWPAPLASRSALPPPGVAPSEELPEEEEVGGWLDMDNTPRQRPQERPRAARAEEALPASRSLLTVVQATLSIDRARHNARYAVVPPEVLALHGDAQVPVSEWLEVAAQPLRVSPNAGAHALGPPLDLPGRVGYPIAGWLTRTLEVWPSQPSALRPGELSDRDVRSPWLNQVKASVFYTMATVVPLLLLSVGLRLLAQPHPQQPATLTEPSAHPAISVCSEDAQQFIAELRCQVDARARGVQTPVCRDLGAESYVQPLDLASSDLQAAFCGLYDRDNPVEIGGKRYDAATVAAAQACFNVLGQPDAYRLSPGQADPEKLTSDPDLYIRPLQDVLSQLGGACTTYRERLEERVAGAIFATHIGAPDGDSEASRLRASLASLAVYPGSDAARCFAAGMERGVSAPVFSGLCGADDALDKALDEQKSWKMLKGSGTTSALTDRYTQARFPGEASSDLWQCHQSLTGRASGPAVFASLWELGVPRARRYETVGLVRSQLVLDDALRTAQGGRDLGACWRVVTRRLSAYTPVHPLIAATDASWPSAEQQVCGQICAARYQLRPEPDHWVTPSSDLGMCMKPEPPAPADFGSGVFDRLRLPWNYAPRQEWRDPSAAEICAFHLIAQDYMPPGDDGFLVGGVAAPLWAGATETGSLLAGGQRGLATQGAENLSAVGRSHSANACGHVAAQCFTAIMLETMGESKVRPYEWSREWSRRVGSILSSRSREVVSETAQSPWCSLIKPYMSPDNSLPEGQIDYPCARGVEDARQDVARVLATFSAEAEQP